MTTAEITAFVMAMSPEEVCRRAAEDVMGWTLKDGVDYVENQSSEGHVFVIQKDRWHPDTDRNQSRMVTDRVGCDHEMRGRLEAAICRVTSTPNRAWQIATALDETRAALIAHYVSKGGIE